MKPILENTVLTTDLDADFYNLRNVSTLDPVPVNLALSSDPRLTDARVPLDGSVTDFSVANGAAIVQSKLNLNGQIPPAWLGSSATTAAQGDLAEYLSNKGQPNGYAGLDGGGKVPALQLPTGIGTGTVTSVGLTMPAQFSVGSSPVTGSGTLSVTWANVSDESWFGNKSGAPAAPQFYTTAFPTSLIPSLDAGIVTSGTFAASLLPVMAGLGGGHAAGAVPDPGAGGGGAAATDYLARDGTWKTAPTIGPTYQPLVPDPTINHSAEVTGPQKISLTGTLSDAALFYSTTSAITGFAEFPAAGYFSLGGGDTIWVYAAHPGFNNSNVVSYTNPNPP